MNSFLRIFLLVLLMSAAAACDGTVATEDAEEPELAGDEVPYDPDQAATEEAAEFEMEAADTESEESADLANNGDNDHQGDMSEAGEEAAELEEDQAFDEDKEEDAGAMLADDALVWGESQTPSQTACDLEIMPLREGATWQYESDDGVINWEVTEVDGDLQEAIATMIVSFAGFSFENKITCSADEGIIWTDFSKQGMSEAFPGLVMISEEVDGVFLPSGELAVGDSWNTQQRREFTFTMDTGDVQTEASGLIKMDQSDRVLSTNPVTALDNLVDGVQIEQTSLIDMTMEVQGTPYEQVETLIDTIELGKGFGMVRHKVETELLSAVWELTAVEIP